MKPNILRPYAAVDGEMYTESSLEKAADGALSRDVISKPRCTQMISRDRREEGRGGVQALNGEDMLMPGAGDFTGDAG